jgi:hypothetical protein
MSGTLHRLHVRADAVLTKRQLADHLCRSERWVEQRTAEGMPKGDLDRYGRRRYRLSDCEAWLAEDHERPKSRIEELEARVDALEGIVRAYTGENTKCPGSASTPRGRHQEVES